MDQNEHLPTDQICSEYKKQFSGLTGEEENDVADETSDVISTSMLTPPPTGESLLNGSSRSSISGNDLQPFTNDELTQQSPDLSHQTDEGNSNQSSNSDSADSKLIINEGSIDSSDVSNIVYNKLKTDVQMNRDDSNECNSPTPIENDVVTNNTLDQVIPENAVETVEFTSTAAEENKTLSNLNEPRLQPMRNVSEESKNDVPLQTVNGVVCQNDDDLNHKMESENISSSETKHRKLKRKLSDSEENSFETAHKQTKLNNQTNTIDVTDNQLDVGDSVPNHVDDHNQIIESCDNLINSDVQNNEDSSMTSVLFSQTNANENIGTHLAFQDLLSVTKESIDENIDEREHMHMNGHNICGEMETILSIESPRNKQQPIFESTNDPIEEIQSIQSYTSDNHDEHSNTQAEHFEANSRIDRIMIQPQQNKSLDQTNSLTTNNMQTPDNCSKHNSSIINDNSATSKFVNLPSYEKSFKLSKDKESIINRQYDGKSINTHIRVRRQVFLCSACGTYYEKWNLFYHIREVHNKFICLFENCLGIFPNAERLVHHLESKHVNKPFVYEHKDDLLKSLKKQCFLMCCVCEHIFTENDDVTAHSCETFMKPCTVCGLTFIHKSSCSALLSNKTTKHKQKRSASNTVQEMMQASTMPNNISQQTFLRNALLGQEMRLNRYSDFNNSPGISQVSMVDHRLNKLPLHLHSHSNPHPSTHPLPPPSRLQSQIHPQLHQPVSFSNDVGTQQSLVIFNKIYSNLISVMTIICFRYQNYQSHLQISVAQIYWHATIQMCISSTKCHIRICQTDNTHNINWTPNI